ncbi:carbamoyl-phosphate synthase (glutamine-hydrolyzing) large subunit [Candidatus Woesearchaeota archaeon]|nr:carbamoyl-phosphate synthase (glutamine-hydrolyzing) large subunit [Candidatus Woesearchaeota archaeon]
MIKRPKKVLLLGSGALKIGQAGEFDYSGSQALKALKDEGIATVLINPNIATIQTSEGMADAVYFLPVDPHFVERVIEKERPDAIMLSFGGQTALNCGVELHTTGVFAKHTIGVLGTPVDSIIDTEDRGRFVARLDEIGVKTPRSFPAGSLDEARAAAKRVGYPVMLRVAYALGGSGSGIARTERELDGIVRRALTHAPQVLVEEYLAGWKEVEYEVVRDSADNCITVCNMENFDPLGIHTGESIVVAPSQTLDDHEYHRLRAVALEVIRHFGIVGECNIQYALDPHSDDYRVIEVNARLSRSSALASKATGYPLAYVATKLALGHTLPELANSITQRTSACFEPALDYVVVKVPRWDLQKFRNVSKLIGSEMKSVGEVMAIGRTFEEALQKAVRMLQVGMHGVVGNRISFPDVRAELRKPTDRRLFAIPVAMRAGIDVEEIHHLSRIDRWFLHSIRRIVSYERRLSGLGEGAAIPPETLLEGKRLGFSDAQIATVLGTTEDAVREERKRCGIMPFVKQIDTLAAEYPARTNYLYLTYNATEDDVAFGAAGGKRSGKRKAPIIVLGSGAYRIGSSVEFDWCAVSAAQTLSEIGHETIMINYNPETVSTDYDVCDRLYFDELSFESVQDIYEKERPEGIILSVGGQIPNNLAMRCHAKGLKVIGTSPTDIDTAENRHAFSQALDELGIDQPAWKELTGFDEAARFAASVGYPVLVRPSYILSGAAMNVAFTRDDLRAFLSAATEVSPEHPVVITKFITGAREIEIDAVADKGRLSLWAVSEHVENAGVHSGDATLVLPPQKTYLETIRRIRRITERIAARLSISGPFNIQFIAKDNDIKVIECNLRASRSFPFVSKVCKENFIAHATRLMLGRRSAARNNSLDLGYVGVKYPQFSFSRLKGADPVLGVEMASTGEVGCLGDTLEEAFLKAVIATGVRITKRSVLLSVSGEKNRYRMLDEMRALHRLGYVIYATEHTAAFLARNGIAARRVRKIHERRRPTVMDHLVVGRIGLVINIPDVTKKAFIDDSYLLRRAAIDFSVPLFTNMELAKLFIGAIEKTRVEDLRITAWHEYSR